LINRISESKALSLALRELFGNGNKPVLIRIRGEAGIGKSRLLHDFLESVSDVNILHGHVTSPYVSLHILR